ncbi:feruloyl CoA ortho-hydroxylase F6H1-3-like [Nicotiana tomentosiformis]|uniref:feruloyl CoA ortho-hydroxylase F6H1-3-like n=1 Tax=Nicotiana tomentosiformis TaxID=4098 RepID=UPI00388C6795
MVTVRIVVALVAAKHWLIHQMDVHNDLLNGDLLEEGYMKQSFTTQSNKGRPTESIQDERPRARGAKPVGTPLELNQKLTSEEYDKHIGSDKDCMDELLKDPGGYKRLVGRLLEDPLENMKKCERLDVESIVGEKESLIVSSKSINLNYYPKYPNPDLLVGYDIIPDILTTTLLLQDEIRGLYVRKLEIDAWVHVTMIKGAFGN